MCLVSSFISWLVPKFLVACYATLHPALLVGWLVGRLVSWSVGRLVGPLFTFSAFLSFLSLPLLPKCSCDLLQHCSCPPARDWGGRVSGLVNMTYQQTRKCLNITDEIVPYIPPLASVILRFNWMGMVSWVGWVWEAENKQGLEKNRGLFNAINGVVRGNKNRGGVNMAN